MKKLLAILCASALLLVMLAGCSSNTNPQESPLPSPDSTGTPVETTPVETTPVETEEEPTPWQPPEIPVETIKVDPTQTGDFVIYTPPLTFWMNPVIDRYKELYPNVNVITESFSDYDAYEIRVVAELAAGKGPDIVFPASMFASDINKMADFGAFFDLNDLIEQDADFDLDDYVRPVLDGGIYNGERYIMQYTYEVPVFIASTKTLDEIGFDRSQTGDIASFLNEAARCLPKAQTNPNFKSMFNGDLWTWFFYAFGIKVVDFETDAVLPDEDGLKKPLEAYKLLYHIESDVSISVGPVLPQHLQSGTVIFRTELFIGNVLDVTSELKTKGDYEIFVIPGMDGKIHAMSYFTTIAINSSSSDPQNAWNFIKLMLSPEVQSDGFSNGGPVHKDSIISQAERKHNYFNGDVDGAIHTKLSEEEKQEYLDIVMNVDDCQVFISLSIRRMLNKHMTSYLKGEISYEDALARLRNDLTLYVSE